MSKATITFSLPEEDSEYKMHMKAGDMHTVIYEWTNFLRSKTKYGDGKEVSWEDVRQAWWDTCKESEVDPYGD